jgi:hypothetical protein
VPDVDLFSELDKARQDERISHRGPSPKERAKRKAIEKKQREDAERLREAGDLRERLGWPADVDPLCPPSCPTILAPSDHPDLCAGCRFALERAGIVTPARG